MNPRTGLQPGVHVREVDLSTRISPMDSIEKLHEYLDQGIEIRGHDGQVVMGIVDGEYIVPDNILRKLEQGENPHEEIDDYLDRLGV